MILMNSQKGKDQADWESEIACKYKKAYVDNGNDLTTAHDIKNAIMYLGGVRNSQVSAI